MRVLTWSGLLIACALLLPDYASAQLIRLIPATTDGKEPNAAYEVGPLSGDGRYVLLTSEATNLVGDDTLRCGDRSCVDIFVCDRDADVDGSFDEPGATTTSMVSRASDGTPANGDSRGPSISADGRFVAFASSASNLGPGDTRGDVDVFVHDRQTGHTEIVSVSSTGGKAMGVTDEESAQISANGRVVVFRSDASNLVPDDTNNTWDVFAHDRTTGQTTRVSRSSGGAQADGASGIPAVSGDGRFVAFGSEASTLVVGDTNGVGDVFVHDILTGTTERVSIGTDGQEWIAASFGLPRPAISADGRIVVFASAATGPPPYGGGVVFDRLTRQTSSACLDPFDVEVTCGGPSLSADGRWLAFTGATGLPPYWTAQIVVRDLRHGRSTVVADGLLGSITLDGRFVAFNGFQPDVPAGVFLARLDAASGDFQGFLPDTHLVSPRTSISGEFGASVALEGHRLVVGAPGEDGRGAAYVFEYDGARWALVASLEPQDTGSRFGIVGLSGDAIVVGAPRWPHDPAEGRAYVFLRAGSVWTEQSQLTAPPGFNPQSFGAAVALDHDTLLVRGDLTAADGSPAEGRVVVFSREGTTWNEIAVLSPPADRTNGRASFGSALALDGDRALIGMPDADAAFVFARRNGSWELEATWTGDAASAFGTSVDLDGDSAIVGAPLSVVGSPVGGTGGFQAGTAHVFVQSGATWTEQARLVRATPVEEDRFGTHVALSGPVAAVSVPEVASVLLFVRDGTVWTEREAVRPDPSRNSAVHFPGSLALSGQTLAIGSSWNFSTADEVLVTERSLLDEDQDGLPDGWEARFGLAVAANDPEAGAEGDPDGDGSTNAEELAAGTHPLAQLSATRYLAEGATGSLFDTWIAVANPESEPANVLLRFLGDGDWASAVVIDVPPFSLRRVHVNEIPDLGTTEFSTVIESNTRVVVEREMTWDHTWRYGSHADAAVASAATTWYFAEGATHSGFDLFYLLQNPGDIAADVKVTYMRPSPLPPIERTYVVRPRSRFNIWVDTEPELDAVDVSAVIASTNGVPIIAERAMYVSSHGRVFTAGHDAVGAVAPALEWTLAEGATGAYFDLFLLVANPSPDPAELRVRYLRPDGMVITRQYRVAPRSRFNIWVDYEAPELADTAVSTVVSSTNGVPVVVERAMWWPGPTAATWAEAHVVLGSTESATRWAFAAGQVDAPGEPASTITVHVASDMWGGGAPLVVTLGFADGSFAQKGVGMPGATLTIDPAVEFPEAAGRPFGVHVRSGWRRLCGPHSSCFTIDPVAIEVDGGRRLDAYGLEWLADDPATDTYFLVANLGAGTGTVRVTLLYEDGIGPSRDFALTASSRLNIDVRAEFPEAVGQSFGAVVESVGAAPVPLVVERATYRSAQGLFWAAGSAAMGTRLP